MQHHYTHHRAGWRALRRTIVPAFIAVSAAAFGGAASAQQASESALINKLVQKGILSTKDAQELQAEVEQETSQSSANKLVLAAPVSQLKLYGDLRERYQFNSVQFQAAPANVGTSLPIYTANTTGSLSGGNYYQTKTGTFAKLPSSAVNPTTGAITFPSNAKAATLYKQIKTAQVDPSGFQQSRERFRLRLDADINLGQNWFAGVELATGQMADSSNATFGGTSTATGDNGGAFNKYSIYVSKAFLGWHDDWLTVVVGKFANPFYTTNLVWDPDINPDGIYESIAFHKLFHAGGAAGPTGDASKDGKGVAPTLDSGSPWELTLNAGQFIYQDNNEGGAKLATAPTYLDAAGNTLPSSGAAAYSNDTDSKTDVWLFQTQLVASYKFKNNIKATIAPGWLFESAGSVSGADGSVNFNDSTLVSGASRNINLLLLPGDISFKIGGIPTKFYWDAAYNLDGRKREENTYLLTNFSGGTQGGVKLTNHQNEDNFAYLVGVQLGENRKAGDLSLILNWRQTGIASVDPNLNDNEYALGYLNTRGLTVSLAYNVTDFVVADVNYFWANNIRKNLVGGEATTDNQVANANSANVLEFELSIKF